jgi:transposase
LSPQETVKAYKSLSQVEQAFRSFKTVDLKVRSIYHHTTERVKAHVFLCMLAYDVEWHMRSLLASMLFDEDDWESAHLQQKSAVKAQASERTKAKARTKRTVDNLPVHSFQTLLADLGTLAHNQIQSTIKGASSVGCRIFSDGSDGQKLESRHLHSAS